MKRPESNERSSIRRSSESPLRWRGRGVGVLGVALTIVAVSSTVSAQDGGGFSIELGGQLALGAPEDSAATSPLAGHIQRLRSEDPVQRLEAVRALGALADPAAVDPLISAAESDPRPEIRGWAVRALHRIGTPEALVAVRRIAENDSDERVRALAGGLIAQLEPPVPAPEPEPAVESSLEIAAPEAAVVEAEPVIGEPFGLASEAAPEAAPEAVIAADPGVDPSAQVVLYPQEMTSDYAQRLELRRVRRAGLGLRISGWILFGITYGTAFMAGASITADDADDGWPLMLPLIGPAITGFRIMGDDDHTLPLGVLAIAWSLLEIAGFSMAVAGHVRRSRARRQYYAAEEQRAQRQVALLPSGPGDGPGLSLAATF
jgi:hypothetical protein